MDKKYELLKDQTIEVDGHTLRYMATATTAKHICLPLILRVCS